MPKRTSGASDFSSETLVIGNELLIHYQYKRDRQYRTVAPVPPPSCYSQVGECVCVCVCVCVVIPFILDVRLVDVPAGVTQDFSTFLLRCLLDFSREKDSTVSFPHRTLSRILCPKE